MTKMNYTLSTFPLIHMVHHPYLSVRFANNFSFKHVQLLSKMVILKLWPLPMLIAIKVYP